MKFTPGPWEILPDVFETGIAIQDLDGKFIVAEAWSMKEGDIDKDEVANANAKLIAAAPELLTSLIQMVEMFERHIDGLSGPDDAAQRWDAARAAIAKAKGESDASET